MSLRKEHPKEYRVWKALRARCFAPCLKDTTYQIKGITVCERWNSFDNFFNDMGECPEGYSIDRINNDGNYEPSNCRWADTNTQVRNRGDFNDFYSYEGKSMCLKDWAKELNIGYTTLRNRIYYRGMSFEEAIVYVDERDRPLEWQGNFYTRDQLCEMYNIPKQNFYDRWHKGWSLERILTTPISRR